MDLPEDAKNQAARRTRCRAHARYLRERQERLIGAAGGCDFEKAPLVAPENHMNPELRSSRR
jgi:hypothetical protein